MTNKIIDAADKFENFTVLEADNQIATGQFAGESGGLGAGSALMDSFQIWVVQECENGAGNHPGALAMRVRIVDGKLIPLENESEGWDPRCTPLARTIQRKLAPRSGNHLFVS